LEEEEFYGGGKRGKERSKKGKERRRMIRKGLGSSKGKRDP